MAYSLVTYTGDGATTSFAVPFPFISRDHITAKVNGVPRTISWINDGLIQLYPAPVLNAVVVIIRDSSRATPLVDFQDAQLLTETDLDLSARQNLYVAQEAFDAATSSEIAAAVEADALAAAQSAVDSANWASASQASAMNSANSAAASASSAADAAATAASIGNVFYLDAFNEVQDSGRATIRPNVTYDLVGNTLATTFLLQPETSPAYVPPGKTFTGFRMEGNYNIQANSNVATFDIDVSSDAVSAITGSLYGIRSKVVVGADGAGYGIHSQVGVPPGSLLTNVSLYPVYLKVNTDSIANVHGSLMTLEVAGGAVPAFDGYGLEVKGTGAAPSINYPFAVQPSVLVSGGALWYSANPSAVADFLLYNVDGESDFRFRIDANGSLRFGVKAGQRFLADFSNATHASRFLFQDNGTDKPTVVGVMPSGTGTVAGVAAYGGSDPNNTHFGRFNANVVANTIGIDSAKNGTGTVRDFVFSFSGADKVRITATGRLGVGIDPAGFGVLAAVETSAAAGVISAFIGNNVGSVAGDRARLSLGPCSGFVTSPTLAPYVEAYLENLSNDAALTFGSYLSTAGVREVGRFSAAGDFGVGTTSPVSFGSGIRGLEVAGYAGPASGGAVRLRADDSSTIVDLSAYLGDGTLQTSTNGNLKFGTNNSERARITTLGNLLVGMTAEAPVVASRLSIKDVGAQGCNFYMLGDGAVTPSKTIRAKGGSLEVVDHAYASVLATVTDGGNFVTKGAVMPNVPSNVTWSINTASTAFALNNATTYALAAASGLVLVTNHSNGHSGLFLCSGGAVILVSTTAPSWVAGAPAAGKAGVEFVGGVYRINNNIGAAQTFAVCSIATRNSV